MKQTRQNWRRNLIAGIDIGSTTIAVVLLHRNGTIVFKDYRCHNGNIYAALENIV